MSCPGTLLCKTKCNTKDCPVLSETANITDGYNIQTNTTLKVFDFILPIHKVDRKITWSYSHNLVSNYDTCTTSSTSSIANITENCKYTNTRIHYINQQDKICLYTQDEYTLAFSGDGAGLKAYAVPGEGSPRYSTFVPVESVTKIRNRKVILIKNGTQNVIYKNTFSKFGDLKYYFFLPTPEFGAKAIDPEIAKLGYYNKYLPASQTAPYDGSLTALDGGYNFYFPEWLRDIITDPLLISYRDHMHAIALLGSSMLNKELPYTAPPLLDNVPAGSYVKHPEGNSEFYNFLLRLDDDTNTTLNIKSSDTVDGALMQASQGHITGISSNTDTIYYPISLY